MPVPSEDKPPDREMLADVLEPFKLKIETERPTGSGAPQLIFRQAFKPVDLLTRIAGVSEIQP